MNIAILGCWHVSSNNAHPWPSNEIFTVWLTATATLDDNIMLGAAQNLGSHLPAASCSLDTYQEIPGPPLLSRNMGWASSADCQNDSLAIVRLLPARSTHIKRQRGLRTFGAAWVRLHPTAARMTALMSSVTPNSMVSSSSSATVALLRRTKG